MTELEPLIEQLKLVLQLEDDDPKEVAKHAASMAQNAARKGNKHGVEYWKGVLSRAQDRLKSAAGQTPGQSKPGSHDTSTKPKEGPKGLKAKLKAVGKAAGSVVKNAAVSAIDRVKNAPADAKRLVTDSNFRKEVGHQTAEAIKRGAAKAVLHAIGEVAEVAKSGIVLTKIARGQKLSHEDKHVLKAGAKAIASTVIGTMVVGGIAHLTLQALATHFALETATKSAVKAAIYAELATEAEKEVMLHQWTAHIVRGIEDGFASLGDMSQDKIADIVENLA